MLSYILNYIILDYVYNSIFYLYNLFNIFIYFINYIFYELKWPMLITYVLFLYSKRLYIDISYIYSNIIQYSF